MATVKVVPMPDWARQVSRRLWPCHEPIFDDTSGPVTEADRELARKLFLDLDEMSKEFYRQGSTIFEGL